MKGADAEDLALAFLRARGLHLLARNQRAPGGEIDLVMRHDQTVVMVEVRKRSSARFGSAAESVDARKQARIVRAASGLLARHADWAQRPVRFDVVTLDADDHIEWIADAFEAPS